ncbi:hypothetical protein NSE_0648 [Neorickettsia sennetsu str. Miyayama]|uniref:Uncharacterized protein n=1 Tax=Ehrlichia sennetsu (strain ATCC VR-367 / Miyayama) TaxID=222891 RepID=Q2GDC0_EHRS3|nr:hypothetical protein NSE_0648 [Neorickettsia sennetsu str. Miyayama]
MLSPALRLGSILAAIMQMSSLFKISFASCFCFLLDSFASKSVPSSSSISSSLSCSSFFSSSCSFSLILSWSLSLVSEGFRFSIIYWTSSSNNSLPIGRTLFLPTSITISSIMRSGRPDILAIFFCCS